MQLEIEPIIAPHLLEEEKISTIIPPFKSDSASMLLSVLGHDSSNHPVYVGGIDDENDNCSIIFDYEPTHDSPDELSRGHTPLLIKRRNASHEPPPHIVPLVHHDHHQIAEAPPSIAFSDRFNEVSQQGTNPFTAATDEPEYFQNDEEQFSTRNPFESGNNTFATLKHSTSPLKAQKENVPPPQVKKSINPFDIEQGIEVNAASSQKMQSNTEDRLDKQQQRKQKKRTSWITNQANRLSLNSLSSSSHSVPVPNVPGNKKEELHQQHTTHYKTPKRERFNPFKRYLRSTTDDEIAEEQQQRLGTVRRANTAPTSPSGGLKKEQSNRRNALHGPF